MTKAKLTDDWRDLKAYLQEMAKESQEASKSLTAFAYSQGATPEYFIAKFREYEATFSGLAQRCKQVQNQINKMR